MGMISKLEDKAIDRIFTELKGIKQTKKDRKYFI